MSNISKTNSSQSPLTERTRCHTSDAVIRTSATAENASQMMTMTLNCVNRANSGTIPTAMDVPSPPPTKRESGQPMSDP